MKFLAPQALRDILERCPCPNPKIHFYGNPVYLALSGKGQWQRIHSRDKFRIADYVGSIGKRCGVSEVLTELELS